MTRHLQNLLKVAATTVGMISITATGANAGVLTTGTTVNTFLECINDGVALQVGLNNTDASGWQYAADSAQDGVSGNTIGNNTYEIYGMSIKETADSIFVALNANMPLTGASESSAQDGNIGWGDLFFNFTQNSFQAASNAASLFGVRFAGTNDSGAPNVGVYSNVTAKSVTNVNSGFSSIESYNKYVSDRGGIPSLGDLSANTSYFDQNQSMNAIASGTFLTGITYLSNLDLTAAGYNFNKFAGSQTIAFKFDKSQLPGGTSVPEPSSVIGLAAIGLAVGGSKLRRTIKA